MVMREKLGEIRTRLLELLRLKDLPRAGWLRVGLDQPESVASHSWGVAWLVLALCPANLDRGKALAMATIHDVAEVRVGDITPHDGVPAAEKSARELAVLRRLVRPFEHADELESLWLQFEEGASAEGRFVRACDRLDMALQAQHYRDQSAVDTSEFIESALSQLEAEDLRWLAGCPIPESGRRSGS